MFFGTSVALPGVIAESARRFRDPRISTPDWQQRKELQTRYGPITYRFIDRGVVLYSKSKPLCDEPHKFTYRGLRYFSDDRPRDGYPHYEPAGPIARTITWRVLGKIPGVNVMNFGAIESIEDPWMVFVGISPGYEDKSAQILEQVASVMTKVLIENEGDLERALSAEDAKQAKAKLKQQEERRKAMEAARSQ